jgi:hypothetical protein
MRAFLLAAGLALAAAGCIGGDFAGDAGVTAPPDLSVPIFDLSGLDLYGAYNCQELNGCENACTTAVCVFNCRKMATPTATFEEIELQDCFSQYCPKASDLGTAICTPSDLGTYSAVCTTCIDNTYASSGKSCAATTDLGTSPECHKCLVQASTCSADP